MVFKHRLLLSHKLEISQISQKTTTSACRMIEENFKYYQSKNYSPSERIKASLKSKEWKSDEMHFLDMKYFVLKEQDTTKILGVVGFCRKKKDSPQRLWIDWLVVDPRHRGKGFGSLLVDFAIMYAKYKGVKFLALYTTDNKEEAKAQTLYAKRDFVIRESKPSSYWTGFVKEKKIA